MATTRPFGFKVTSHIWNEVLSCLNDAGNVFTGAFNGSTIAATTAAFSGAVTMASTLAVTGAVTLGNAISAAGAAVFGGAITERGRSTPLGEFVAVPYSAFNFYGVDSLGSPVTWDVASGDILVNRYTLVGETMTWNLLVSASAVPAGIVELRATIPAGLTSLSSAAVKPARAEENGTPVDAYASVGPGTTHVGIAKTDATDWASSPNTTIWFQIQIEVSIVAP